MMHRWRLSIAQALIAAFLLLLFVGTVDQTGAVLLRGQDANGVVCVPDFQTGTSSGENQGVRWWNDRNRLASAMPACGCIEIEGRKFVVSLIRSGFGEPVLPSDRIIWYCKPRT